MKFREGDSVLSMSVIRAAQVAAEEQADEAGAADDSAASELFGVHPQYVFTITDGGFAKRTRITEYRVQSRGGIGIKAMSLSNEDRGGLVGAFIVEEQDEVLSITEAGQVVRSPIDEHFRATGRSTMGVKFVTPKKGDSVAVVARSVEASGDEESAASEEIEPAESPVSGEGATIEDQAPAGTSPVADVEE